MTSIRQNKYLKYMLVLIISGFAIPTSGFAALEAAASTTESITLTWTAVGDDGANGTASFYDIRYSTSNITNGSWSSATQVSGEPTPSASGTTETFTVTGLNPGTTYYFALKVGDEVPNWSVMSNVIQKTTNQESTPPNTIADLGVTIDSESSLTLSWTAPGDDGTVGTASSYDIRMSTLPITTSNWNSATQLSGEPTPASAGSAETMIIGGLNPSTQYYFAMMAADEVPNWSGMSNVANGTTSIETTPPATIANLGASSETETTITLSWTAPGDDGNSGTADQYDIRYSTSPITDANFSSATQATSIPSPNSAGTVENFVVTGLSSNTTYYFAVKTADEVPNWSGLSNVVSRSTAPDQTPPSGIMDLSAATGLGDGELGLGWTAPGDNANNALVNGYEIRYSTREITEFNWASAQIYNNNTVPVMPGQLQGIMLTGLNPGQFYYLAVKSFDSENNMSPISNSASATAGFNLATDVDGNQPNQVSPLNGAELFTSKPILVVENKDDQVTESFTFEVATDSNFIVTIDGAVVTEGFDATTSWKVNASLNPDQSYFWRVRSETGEYSEVFSFTVRPEVHAYPNPFRAETDQAVTITDLPMNSDLMITTVSGETIRSWSSINTGEIVWDGTNESGSPIASGVYLWFAANGKTSGKIVVVR